MRVPSPLLLLVAAGCTAPDHAGTRAVPEWRLTAMADIGVAEGQEMLELSQATSSLRLGDGRILVANSGSQEIRVFDSAGSYLSSIGRKGQGPGEFEGVLQIRPAPGGGFTVFDAALQRLSAFDSAGAFVEESRITVQGNTFPLSTWLHRDNWIDGPVDTVRRAVVARVLDRLPAVRSGSYRFVKAADDGRLWIQVRDPRDSSESWQVRSGDGALLARVEIPRDLEVHSVSRRFITARRWDADDVEHVVLFSIEGNLDPQFAAQDPAATSTPAAVPAEVREAVARQIRNLVMVQETHYADHGAYATRASDLAAWNAPSDSELHLLEADRRGWVGILVSRSYPYLCGMAVGGSTPPGWGEGDLRCSR